MRALGLAKEGVETLFVVNNSPETIQIQCEGRWAGEYIACPGQLSRIAENDDPMARESIAAEGALSLPPWSLTAARAQCADKAPNT